MNETQNQNPLIRFIDDQMVETVKNIKESALENEKQIKKVRETCLEAQARLIELMKQTYDNE